MKIRSIFAGCAIALMMASCSSQKTPLTYFKGVEEVSPIPVGDYLAKIEPSDELFITVQSKYNETANDYNLLAVNPGTNASSKTPTTARNQTYVVDSKGDIQFPKLGYVHVAGLTVEQLRDLLTERIGVYVKEPLVKVEIVNFKVDVAGEVLNPGQVQVTDQRFSVLDALTAAGDLTTYGTRDNVLVVREENGKRTTHRLNLNDPATLSSPYFFVKQNDYIYVEPSPVRQDNADYNQNNSYKLSVVSTIVSGASVIVSLIIALSVK